MGDPMYATPGHRVWVEKTESGKRWRARCECGWNDPDGHLYTTRSTERTAGGHAIWHVTSEWRERQKAAQAAKRNGVSPSSSYPSRIIGAGGS